MSDLYFNKMALVFRGEWARGASQKKQGEELGSCYQKLERDDGGIRIIGIACRVGGVNLEGKGARQSDCEILNSGSWVDGSSMS